MMSVKLHKACPYCGAKRGEQCIVTLAPEVGPLSIPWAHRAREESGLVGEVKK